LASVVGQLQDVGFVFLNILICRGDAQIADDAGGRTSAFLRLGSKTSSGSGSMLLKAAAT
jgi:hypothetical protein